MEDKVVRAARPQERQFVCVPLSDVSKSVDLACVFAVNAMVFKCECEDPRAVQAGDHLAALLQDMIDVAAELDQACQHALSAEVYGVVRELRRLGFAVAIGHGVLDVHGAPWPASPALKSWDVLCVVLRDADKAVPLALVPTPMNIA